MNEREITKLITKVLGKGSKIEKPLLGGMMNVSYIVSDENGKKYVLYVSTKQANEMVDRPLEKEHQQIVSSLGLTSKNVYFDTEKGIKINEYIEGSSIDKVEKYDYDKVAEMFRKLHNSVMLSRVDYAPFERFVHIYEKEALSYLDGVSPLYQEIRTLLFTQREFLESQRKVLSHNDAQKSNIVQTPEDDYYFIDFEFMGNNDEIYDIAAFGNGDVKEGRELLNHYFKEPNENQIRRYYLWRMFISLQWYTVAITKHNRGEGKAHLIDFMRVADHFLNNAKDAYEGYKLEMISKNINDDTERLIVATLDKIRHFLQKDGGDCEFVSFNEGIVYVRMHGACDGCAYANADIKELVEVILQEEVPGVLEVRLAN